MMHMAAVVVLIAGHLPHVHEKGAENVKALVFSKSDHIDGNSRHSMGSGPPL